MSPESADLIELEPAPGSAINRRLTLVRSDGRSAVLMGSVLVHSWTDDDMVAQRVAAVALVNGHLAHRRELARALAVHENTVQRWVRRANSEGVSALVPIKPDRKVAYKVTDEVRGRIAQARVQGLNGTQTRTWLREEFGIELSRGHVFAVLQAMARAEMQQADLKGCESAEAADAGLEAAEQAATLEAKLAEGAEDAVTEEEGQLGATAATMPAIVELPQLAQGRYMGLTLYYGALAAVGLLTAAASSLRLRAAERFDLRAVVLTLSLMSLLRKSTLESAKHLRRLEFGSVVGSGRAPCVKTLRRKLDELGEQRQGGAFGQALARHWVETGVVGTAYLYVDGHMKVYSGKRPLQKVWNSQRRMPLPGMENYVVSDVDGHPLLLVTEDVSPSLSKSLPEVVRQVREVIGERPLTLIFDRGGYDGKLFSWLRDENIDFITYQRGSVDLPLASFSRRETRFEGKRRRMHMAEDTWKVKQSGPWRRIVVRTKDGHQTPILTSIDNVGAARIACLMFARWRQENLFKYMREHHGLDTLVGTRTVDASDQRVPNPEHKRLSKEIAARRAEMRQLQTRLGAADAAGTPLDTTERAELLRRMRACETLIKAALLERKIRPPTVTVGEAGNQRVVFDIERKLIIDQVKLASYNAEEWLLDRLLPHYRNTHDVRDLLRSFAELSGSMHTTATTVEVTLDPPDTPLHRVALRGLCQLLNQSDVRFPATTVPVRYSVAVHHSERPT